ncbi:MAG: hypothetical protein ABGY13_07320, partial [Verrucomicrobiia bacterium]
SKWVALPKSDPSFSGRLMSLEQVSTSFTVGIRLQNTGISLRMPFPGLVWLPEIMTRTAILICSFAGKLTAGSCSGTWAISSLPTDRPC